MAKKEKEAEVDEEQESEETAKKSGGLSTIKIIIIAVTLTLLLGGGLVAGTIYFVTSMNPEPAPATKDAADKSEDDDEDEAENSEEEAAEDKTTEPPQYYSMDPKFVVSFSNQKYARFMQFSLEIMSRDGEIIKKVEEHIPVIRSSLLMLFGGQTYDEMVTREGKEKLLNEVTIDINAVLEKITGDSAGVEAAYFTSFVVQ
ncbi:hypothetical protein MNBD_GAMMA06-118 [hydrothermal vent metagenome]|uniref:Flagellar biosynthesis protein FliL n=1 Tax=hydrothermal vent metagenome TaxID=652676 RepID=A0A3B0WNH7_9ZZZZ